MSDTTAIMVAIIAATPGTLVARVGLYRASQNAKAQMEKSVTIENKVDGRFTELLNALLALTRKSSFRDGEDSKAQELKDAVK